jgi:hypothetical protein
MKKKEIILSMILFLMFSYSNAVELESGQFDLEIESLKNSSVDYLGTFGMDTGDDAFDSQFEGDESIYKYEYKSPKKAFFLSLLIPGLGQLYNGSHMAKTAGVVALEVGAWVSYFKFHADGEDKTRLFESFADAHWFEGDTTGYDPVTETYPNLDPQTYRGWLLDNEGSVDDTSNIFTHTLPGTRTQQYYEMIGKYDQFRGGWDDYWAPGHDPSDFITYNRLHYENMRKSANDDLDFATKMIYVSMFVHLASAVDAAISANRNNKKQTDDSWSLKVEMYQYTAAENIPILKFSQRF